MSSETELITLIEKLVEEKTFSLEGAKAIAELKRSVESKDGKIKGYEERIALYIANVEKQEAIKSDLLKQIETYKGREKAIEEREKSMAQKDLRAAVAEAKTDVLNEVFKTIFKTTIVRESVQRKVTAEIPPPYAGQVPTTYMREGDSEVKTTEME